jgi:citrate lyase subunit beta / citryl-CoA lyase
MTVRRAAHFVPGANEKMLTKSLATAADSLILDLEDAVTPDNKDSARATVAAWLAEVDFGRQERVVRINPLGTPWCEADIAETMASPPDAYLVPKVNNAAEIDRLDRLITQHESDHGHPEGGVQLLVLGTETPQGLLNIADLAAHERVDALTWGAEDLSAAIGSRGNRDASGAYLPVFEYAKVMCLLGATAWQKQPLDTVFVDFNDPDALRAECLASAAMGYTGKITIHPNQIDIVNEAFTPSEDEVNEARELLALFAENEAKGIMAFSYKGEMVDVPHLTRATKIVELAESLSGL